MVAAVRKLFLTAGWSRADQSRRPSPLLVSFAIFTCVLAVAPLVYILIRAAGATPGTWDRLWSARIPGLMLKHTALVACTAAITGLLGVGGAGLGGGTEPAGR